MTPSSRRSPFASFRRHPLALAISALLLGGAVMTDAAAQAFPATFVVSGLNGSNGFRLDGVASGDVAAAVSRAGDINGDGIGDLIIGAFGADPNGTSSGSSYVVFGKSTPFAATLALSSLNGANGFRLDGVAAGDYSGRSVSAAGDVNGDGLGDLIVGAYKANTGGSYSGSSYVVFGKSTPFAATLALSSLNGANGFRLDGVAGDYSGFSVSAAGDVNGDGFDDLLIGAYQSSANGHYSGSAYVIFGKSTPFAATLALSSLNGSNGFRLDGAALDDHLGISVSAAGDINGDGLGDFFVGALEADPNGPGSGSSYVVFGKSTPFGATLVVSGLNGANGFRLDGVAASDFSGSSVSAAGDINGDGFGDLIIGANSADSTGSNSGSSYVVFGKSAPFAAILALSSLNGVNGFRLDGAAADDGFGAVSAAGDVNGDGHSDVIIGAKFADPNGSFSGSSYVIFGRDANTVFKNGFE